MSNPDFPTHTLDTAPDGSKPLLEKVKAKYGGIPNILAHFAASPALLETYMMMSEKFGKTSFSPEEQQILLITISQQHSCHYCVAAHSTSARDKAIPSNRLDLLRARKELDDPKLEALRQFAILMVEKRGWPDKQDLQKFFDAGYTPTQALEVNLAMAMKIITNYSNHLCETDVDDMFAKEKVDPKTIAA